MWRGIGFLFLFFFFLLFPKNSRAVALYLVHFRNDDAGEKHSAYSSGGAEGCAISTFQLNGPSK
ncbi:hypothetical protein BDV33DRAFT_178446 [Aspergillus novoparasiticus]|uniref:Secreted protein n=1 Tax=Aspergillus novoparasiticus TaxID=986946 RepID=A0A5N6EK19_9EURO|nr:hypothetical protein BDV33DRAFT_178446 [Aspergillus novoparasiticus]